MPIQLTPEGFKAIFPRAPQQVVDAFILKQDWLTKVGVNETRTRLSYFFSQIEHECGGFAIRNLTESTAYTHERAAQVWPNRFPGGASQVRQKYGADAGWQLRMLDDVYGNRMGNRAGTRDGSRYIGRGGPQWTGRDGYAALAAFTGLDAVNLPELAARYELQPEVCAAFWDWKKLNKYADTGNFRGCTKVWNGGYIGQADREAKLAGNDPIIARLKNVERILPQTQNLPGGPSTTKPPKEVEDEATKNERAVQKAGGAGAVVGGGGEVAKTQTSTEVAQTPLLSPFVTFTLIGAGVAMVIIAAVLIARKKSAIAANWF